MHDAVDEVGVHVDDVSQLLIGTDRGDIIKESLRAADRLTRALIAKGFTVSDKSRLVTSDLIIGKRLISSLRALNLPIKWVRSSEDLGVSSSAGKHRTTGLCNKRMDKSHKRAGNVGVISRFHKDAKNMAKTGVRPQSKYGQYNGALSPSHLHRERAAQRRCMGNMGWRPCISSVLAFKGKGENDPEVISRLEQINS